MSKNKITSIILAAGKSSRFENPDDQFNKCLQRLNSKALIIRTLEHCQVIGSQEILIVINKYGQNVKDIIGTDFNNIPITYCVQEEQIGLLDAYLTAESHIRNKENTRFLFLSDEFFVNPRHESMLSSHLQNGNDITFGVISTSDHEKIKKNYSVEYDENKNVLNLIEKPQEIINNIIGTGSCIFSSLLINDFLKSESSKNELVDIINYGLSNHKVLDFDLADDYININTEDDLRQAERLT